MAIEIERKFLVDMLSWEQLNKPEGKIYRQGYLLSEVNKSVRIRASNEEAFITIKGKTEGAIRPEYEYSIPLNEALELLNDLCDHEISKTRYEIIFDNKKWEVDVFHGVNEGLIVAEIELKDEHEIFSKPDWVTREVTGDAKYYNASLALNPFRNWQVSS